MIIIHANLQVQPDQEHAFLEAARAVVEGSRKETGNIGYDLKKSTDQEGHYTMVELWKDAAATQAHNKSDHFQAFSKQAATFMAAPMDLNVYSAEPVNM